MKELACFGDEPRADCQPFRLVRGEGSRQRMARELKGTYKSKEIQSEGGELKTVGGSEGRVGLVAETCSWTNGRWGNKQDVERETGSTG